MDMLAAKLGCKSAMVGTGYASFRSGCMERRIYRKGYTHLVGGSFLVLARRFCVDRKGGTG